MSDKHIKLPATEYKISTADFVTVDDVLEEATMSLTDIIAEAYKKALKEDIKANTVIIDEHFAKVNAFDFVFVRDVMSLPPMICGLEIHVSDELPDGYDFAVLEVPETERDRLVRKTRANAIKEFAERLKADIVETGDEHGLGNSYPVLTHNYIDTLVKEMTEGNNESKST